MPAKTTSSQFSLNDALKQHRKDQTVIRQDFTSLPGGIVNGVAELVSASIGEYKNGDMAGKKFVRLAATVIEPTSVQAIEKMWKANGTQRGEIIITRNEQMKVKGLQTSQMFPLCDSKSGSADENVARLLNELRTIGGDDFTEDIESEDDLAGKLDLLVEARPYIRFGTTLAEPSKEYPKSRVWENWYGRTDYEPPVGANGSMVDKSASKVVASANGRVSKPDPNPEGIPEEPASDTMDELDALAEKANEPNADSDAQAELEKLALEAGVEQGDIDSAKDWDAVVAMIRSAGGDEAGSGEDTAAEYEPAKGEVVKIEVLKDPKSPKKGKKKMEVEIVGVDKAGKTVTVKDSDTKKVIMDGKKAKTFGWDELIVE